MRDGDGRGERDGKWQDGGGVGAGPPEQLPEDVAVGGVVAHHQTPAAADGPPWEGLTLDCRVPAEQPPRVRKQVRFAEPEKRESTEACDGEDRGRSGVCERVFPHSRRCACLRWF
jgi:hypothetical protein